MYLDFLARVEAGEGMVEHLQIVKDESELVNAVQMKPTHRA